MTVSTAGRARAFARTSLAVFAIAVAARVVSVDALESLTSRAAALASAAPDHPMVERAVEALVRLERASDATFERLWTEVSENFHPFVIAGPLTFAYHEAVYLARGRRGWRWIGLTILSGGRFSRIRRRVERG